MGKYRSKEVVDIQKFVPGLEDGYMYCVPNGKMVTTKTFEEAQSLLNDLLKQDNVQLSDKPANNGYYFMPFVWSWPKYDDNTIPRLMLECWPTSCVITDGRGRKEVIDVRSLPKLYEKVGE